ncbi:E3 ubiquitin-protein ligase TRIM39 [Dunckerocampus dactyliophorus]|uniref:E3 ubiquitin-protein ligase TRIM39 n=1 Tax=Dunckerocampus dactyliophorus TaxID=161453 RepID=UPI002405A9BA|nr:E3 ubiquitin-protein ligase TRIM39 [Dunckerocampus dactyliophorus]XP_054656069.1 E3 ubiquitin-protein ligase TRIM39 [Dunckerocampus dactyliophorus]
MSSFGSFLSSDQFQCSICLDVFNNPSSTPCGHSFCVSCINQYWDRAKVCQCPLCKRTFQKRPDLQINRTLREITEQFRSISVGGGGGGGLAREKKGGRVREGAMSDALFSELTKKLPRPQVNTSEAQGEPIPSTPPVTTPMASSVPNQSPISAASSISGPSPPPPLLSQPSGRRRFTVSGAASSQNIPICQIHQRGIMIFCRTDGECICPNCEAEEHSGHDTVTVEAAWMDKQAQLKETEQQIQEMITQRLRKIEEMRTSVADLGLAVERETAGSVCMFSELVAAIERLQAELIDTMEVNRSASEQLADSMIRQLEQEVEELRQRESALVKLSASDDHVHGIKNFPAVCNPLPAKDWSNVSVTFDLGTGAIYKSLATQVEKFQERLKSVTETGFTASSLDASPTRPQPRMRRVQEYAVDVTLDCNTAHPRLILSDDMKSVRCGERHQLLPDNMERFDRVVCVLGREAITSGRHYWEVLVGGKTDWDLGVARQSINRKGKIEVTPSNGYWFLSLRDKNKYAFRTEPSTDVHLNLRPNKIGIFVDFDRGQVSFYNVDSKIHIYTFNDTFTECIFPFFSPCTNKSGKNDSPLIITPVDKSE